jgi:pimeloyl-ACP methyl ester carboxylesterase
MDSLVRIVACLAVVYVLLAAITYWLQDHLIFHPSDIAREPAGGHVQAVTLERPDAVLRGWVVKPDATGPLLVYFGGNAEELSGLVDVFARLDATTLLVNYRGYGRSDGRPSAAALIGDGRAVIETLGRRFGSGRPLILYGRSLGSGIAACVTRSVAVDGVILMSPFRTLGHVAERAMPWLPARSLLRHDIDVLAAVASLPQRTLVLYSPEDRIIPAGESRALLEQFATQPAVVEFSGGHNVPLVQPDVWRALEAFVASFSN